MGLRVSQELVSSSRCSCRLGQMLLLDLSWLLAAPQECPPSLPSCLAQVTCRCHPPKPCQHLHGGPLLQNVPGT